MSDFIRKSLKGMSLGIYIRHIILLSPIIAFEIFLEPSFWRCFLLFQPYYIPMRVLLMKVWLDISWETRLLSSGLDVCHIHRTDWPYLPLLLQHKIRKGSGAGSGNRKSCLCREKTSLGS